MFIENVLLSSKLFFNIKNINDGKVTCLKVTVKVLKTLDELLRVSWSGWVTILDFKFSYLCGQLGDAGLYCTSSPFEGSQVNISHSRGEQNRLLGNGQLTLIVSNLTTSICD